MLYVIGIGPGSEATMTLEALDALKEAEVIVGYKTYTHLVKGLTGDKEVIKTGMCKEIERCQAAIELAQAGRKVALISSGDAGIYGMAGLVLELVTKQQLDVEVRLIPGMTIAIEPMINMGTKAVVFERDGWTVRTRDHKPAAHYEFAVAVRKDGPDVLTDFSIIEQAINK